MSRLSLSGFFFSLLSICSLTMCVGCSDMRVAPVTGVVTLDGVPLQRASVVFEPKAGGRPSYSVTDSQGKYTLEYSMESMGAEVGTCIVKVKTGARADDAGNPAVAEKVPAKYFKQPIEVEVQKKSNIIDIELTSK